METGSCATRGLALSCQTHLELSVLGCCPHHQGSAGAHPHQEPPRDSRPYCEGPSDLLRGLKCIPVGLGLFSGVFLGRKDLAGVWLTLQRFIWRKTHLSRLLRFRTQGWVPGSSLRWDSASAPAERGKHLPAAAALTCSLSFSCPSYPLLAARWRTQCNLSQVTPSSPQEGSVCNDSNSIIPCLPLPRCQQRAARALVCLENVSAARVKGRGRPNAADISTVRLPGSGMMEKATR